MQDERLQCLSKSLAPSDPFTFKPWPHCDVLTTLGSLGCREYPEPMHLVLGTEGCLDTRLQAVRYEGLLPVVVLMFPDVHARVL